MKKPVLSDRERSRYKRQIMLFGTEGQERISGCSVFVAGAGGLGSAISFYLASAGFGRIRIVDCDIVEASNLNRQILHSNADLGRAKALSAFDSLSGINPEIEVEGIVERITEDNISVLSSGSDLIIDAMDNFQSRHILNREALRRRIPLIHGAIGGYMGQATTIIPERTGCLSCLFPKSPPVVPFPALGGTCGVIGSIQATEAVKYITGAGELLENRLLLWDGLHATLDEVAYERNPSCHECSEYWTRKCMDHEH